MQSTVEPSKFHSIAPTPFFRHFDQSDPFPSNPFPAANIAMDEDPYVDSAGRATVYAAFAWHSSGQRLEIATRARNGKLKMKLMDWAPGKPTCTRHEQGVALAAARRHYGLPPLLLPVEESNSSRKHASVTSAHALKQARAWEFMTLLNMFYEPVHNLCVLEARFWYHEAVQLRIRELGHREFDTYRFITTHGCTPCSDGHHQDR